MSDSQSGTSDEGAGRKTGSLPLGFRNRARRLYRVRREQLMEVPVEALTRRFGASMVDVDDDFRHARVELSDLSVEVAFAGNYRMFGALIDTQWVGITGSPDPATDQLEYRFDKKAFVVKAGGNQMLAAHLGDERAQKLAARSELKSLKVASSASGRRVVVTPLPGTITAVYFPPLPPYSVPIKPHEANDHIELVLHLLRS